MTQSYRGVVRDNVVVLGDAVRLADDVVVEVRVPGASSGDVLARVLALRRRNEGRYVGIDEIIREDREDREEHVDSWLRSNPSHAL